jgi:membrane-bound inhibitor of C-type lysozyme
MKTSPHVGIIIVVIILIAAGALYFLLSPKPVVSPTMATSTPVSSSHTTNTVSFSCDSGSFTGVFGSSSVMLTLSDGRSLTLPQGMSGSGIRYESTSTPNEDIVLESEGNNAFITENGKTTFNNCVAGTNASSTANEGTKTFTDNGNTFSFIYPSQFTVSGGGVGYSTDWMVNATTSGMLLAKLTIPSSFQPKTNFGDATLTIGTSADPHALKQCNTFSESGGPSVPSTQVTINGVSFTKFSESDAGAGNIYQTTSYRTIRNNQCYAIEYTIHSANIQNYSPDQGITTFDQNKVQSVLEEIVHSVQFK